MECSVSGCLLVLLDVTARIAVRSPVAFARIRGQLSIQMFTKLRPAVSVTLVDVVTQRIGVVELFVTRCTRVVMKTDVLGDAGCALELCIAVCA